MNCCANYSRSRGSRQGVARARTCFNLVGDTWQRPFSDPLPVDSRVCGNDGVACCAPHTYQTDTVSHDRRGLSKVTLTARLNPPLIWSARPMQLLECLLPITIGLLQMDFGKALHD